MLIADLRLNEFYWGVFFANMSKMQLSLLKVQNVLFILVNNVMLIMELY